MKGIAHASAEAELRGLQLAAESCLAGLTSILNGGTAEDELAGKLLCECTAEIERIIAELAKGVDAAMNLGFVNEVRALAGLRTLNDDEVRQPAGAPAAGSDTPADAASAPQVTDLSVQTADRAEAASPAALPETRQSAESQVAEAAAGGGRAGVEVNAMNLDEVHVTSGEAWHPAVVTDGGQTTRSPATASGDAVHGAECSNEVAAAAGQTENSPIDAAVVGGTESPCGSSVAAGAERRTGSAGEASAEQATETELEVLSERLSVLIAGAKAAISGSALVSRQADAGTKEVSSVSSAVSPIARAAGPEAVDSGDRQEVGSVGGQLADAPPSPTHGAEIGRASTEQAGAAARAKTEPTAGHPGVVAATAPSTLGDQNAVEMHQAGDGFAGKVQAALAAASSAGDAIVDSEVLGNQSSDAKPATADSTVECGPASPCGAAPCEQGTDAVPGAVYEGAEAARESDGSAVPTTQSPAAETAVVSTSMSASEPAAPQELTAEQMTALMAGDAVADTWKASLEWGSIPLALAPEKAEMLQFMVADSKAAIEQLAFIIPQLAEFAGREDAGAALADIANSAGNMCDFFDFKSLKRLTGILREVAKSVATINDAVMPELTVRLNALRSLFEQHVRGLECGMELRWPLTVFCDRIRACLRGEAMHPQIAGWHNNDVERVLELDLVNEGINNPPRPEDLSAWTPVMAEASRMLTEVDAERTTKKGESAVVRVPAATLDKMLELISQLVLTKNRMFNLARELRQPALRERRIEDINSAADELTMLTSSLQIAMMQARMQPIARLFERYERVVSDVAGVAEKQVTLNTGGEGVDVDKNIFDGLAEPISLLLRHIVTKAVQLPAERVKAGKPPAAMIRVDARNQSRSVLITVEHDGLSLDREAVLLAAVARGMAAEDKLAAMTDQEVWASYTRDGVTDPAMKAVHQALEGMKGTFSVRPHRDLTRFEMVLPLSIAIIAAILVDIGGEIYAIPLTSVEEIVGLSDAKINRVNNRPVMRLREQVLPIVEGSEAVGIPRRKNPDEIGVVIAASDQRATLRVDGIVGKQEIVIKQLEGAIAHSGPFAGATIRNDGGISLIFDVADLLRRAAP
ncbi:MAG: chemotaxis protein CheW [bacterium]|jgi:chemotaxis protein histidine kinase CheA